MISLANAPTTNPTMSVQMIDMAIRPSSNLSAGRGSSERTYPSGFVAVALEPFRSVSNIRIMETRVALALAVAFVLGMDAVGASN